MEIHVASDLHLEMYKPDAVERVVDRLFPKKGDLLILAGDILYLHDHDKALRGLRTVCDRYNRILFVPGNHEYWYRSPDEAEGLLKNFELEIKGFSWLRTGSVVEYKGKRFLGDTMWFHDSPHARMLLPDWIDNELIKGFAPWVFEKFEVFQKFLKENLQKDDIVISHHAPSHKSTHPRFTMGGYAAYNRFFHDHMEPIIFDKKPAVWIHGHMHDPVGYTIDQTMIYSNPYGYPSENVRGRDARFKEKMILEI